MFLKYLNQRGDRIVLQNIAAIEINENITALEAVGFRKKVKQVKQLVGIEDNYRSSESCYFL